ncbi:FliM/FliN family flagellar motor switch protein [Palleronia pelagia]|uniref:Flagellar motor switch protein FliM n=1 Tax=Palleronia pelagia TaxID=387096 RepID=A0A1H8K061_9RHOB|nr:FliM/FliN family flagellar motor switch protein [Palleronia pelagia]SEN85808.1 flagellar motor switch protein FliM [Palleronia pelagia]
MSNPSPLRRKIRDSPPDVAPHLLTPERMWRRSVSHGLVRSIALEATVGDIAQSTVTPEDLRETIASGSLVALLDGPAGYGLAILDPGGLAAMIEVQTMGRVQSRGLGERPVTALDASMVADALDRVLAVQETLAAELGAGRMVSGYRFAMRIENLREIALSLDDAPHDRVAINFAAGPGGPRQARLDIVLPRRDMAAASSDSPVSSAWSHGLEQRLLGAEVALRATLAQTRMTAAELQALAPGDTVALPQGALGAVALVGPGGHVLGTGRLGQSGGQKAIRLGAASRDFAEVAAPQAQPGLTFALPETEDH